MHQRENKPDNENAHILLARKFCRWTRSYLWGGNFAAIAGVTKEGVQTPLYAVAILLTLVGTFAFFAVLFRMV